MKKLLLSAAILAAFALVSCGDSVESKAEDMAEATCDCVQEAGLESMMGASFGGKMSGQIEACLIEKGKDYLDYFKDLNSADRKDFIKTYLKALVDTKCIDMALTMAGPFMDQALRNADKMMDRALGSEFGPMTVCSCVNMQEQGAQEMREARGDADKQKEIAEKYEAKAKECDEMMKDMSREDLNKAMEDCK